MRSGDGRRGAWPQALENPRPDLAVACGAAYSMRRLSRKAGGIEAGSARAVFLEAHREAAEGGGEVLRRSLVCILPHGAAPGEAFELNDLDLNLRINRLVRFQVYTSTRHDETKAGDVVELEPEEFYALPPLETVATVAQGPKGELAAYDSHPVERQSQ